MKLRDQREAASKVRRLASRTSNSDRLSVEAFLRFHHDRTGRWNHPQPLGEPELEA